MPSLLRVPWKRLDGTSAMAKLRNTCYSLGWQLCEDGSLEPFDYVQNPPSPLHLWHGDDQHWKHMVRVAIRRFIIRSARHRRDMIGIHDYGVHVEHALSAEQAVMLRLLLAGGLHTSYWCHKALGSPSPTCPHCGASCEDSHHILWSCSSWSHVRVLPQGVSLQECSAAPSMFSSCLLIPELEVSEMEGVLGPEKGRRVGVEAIHLMAVRILEARAHEEKRRRHSGEWPDSCNPSKLLGHRVAADDYDNDCDDDCGDPSVSTGAHTEAIQCASEGSAADLPGTAQASDAVSGVSSSAGLSGWHLSDDFPSYPDLERCSAEGLESPVGVEDAVIPRSTRLPGGVAFVSAIKAFLNASAWRLDGSCSMSWVEFAVDFVCV